MRKSLLLFISLFLLWPTVSNADEELRVCAYNVESDGAWTKFVKRRIAQMRHIDLWALSEVSGYKSAKDFEKAAEMGEKGRPNFNTIMGTTGRYDRLVILYNTQKLKFVKKFELHHINTHKVVRSPLVAQLELRSTGQQFLFMVNHLYRGKAWARHKQASQLNAWAAKQRLPLITAGDFNFDWHIPTGRHDKGFDNLVKGGVFEWVRPKKLYPTQASWSPTVLDFVFVAGEAKKWKSEAWIIRRPGDFPDSKKTSDHRPVIARFVIPKP